MSHPRKMSLDSPLDDHLVSSLSDMELSTPSPVAERKPFLPLMTPRAKNSPTLKELRDMHLPCKQAAKPKQKNIHACQKHKLFKSVHEIEPCNFTFSKKDIQASIKNPYHNQTRQQHEEFRIIGFTAAYDKLHQLPVKQLFEAGLKDEDTAYYICAFDEFFKKLRFADETYILRLGMAHDKIADLILRKKELFIQLTLPTINKLSMKIYTDDLTEKLEAKSSRR